MSDNERPSWKCKTPEETARWLWASPVVTIDHRWEMTGVDTSRDWIILERKDGARREFPSGYFGNNPEFEFAPDHRTLIRQKPHSGVWDNIQAIDAWEKRHKRERGEYERLRRKFESPPA